MKWLLVLVAALGCADFAGGDAANAPGPEMVPIVTKADSKPRAAQVTLKAPGYRAYDAPVGDPAPATPVAGNQFGHGAAAEGFGELRRQSRERSKEEEKKDKKREVAFDDDGDGKDGERDTRATGDKGYLRDAPAGDDAVDDLLGNLRSDSNGRRAAVLEPPKQGLDVRARSKQRIRLLEEKAVEQEAVVLDSEDAFADVDGVPDPATTPNGTVSGKIAGRYDRGLDDPRPIDAGEHRIVLEDQKNENNQLAQQARIIPSFQDGRPHGFKVAGIRPGSAMDKIGLKSGDVLVTIDGQPVASPDKALAAYQQLGGDRTVTFEVERSGARHAFTVRMQNAEPVIDDQSQSALHAERWRIADDAWLARPTLTERPDRFLPRMFYFENTYLGRTAAFQERLRRLDQALGAHEFEAATLDPQRLDPPTDAGLSLTTALDRQHLDAPGRVVLQVALQGSQRYGWRRPPLDLAVVLDPLAVAHAPRESRQLLDHLARRLGPKDRLGVILATDPPRVLIDVADLRTARAELIGLDGRVASPGVDLAQGMQIAGARLLAASEGQARVPGSQTVMVLTTGDQDPDPAAAVAHALTVQGAVTSVVDLGGGWDWWSVANAGHGQLYSGRDPVAAVDGELDRLSKVVARLLRVNVKLADGVEAIRVLGSRMLDDDEVKAVKAREVATDLQISKTMGVKADRGDDDDGVQTVIPFFHGGDAHVIMIELWVDRARRNMPVAEVTLRYKDMVALTNATARSHVSLSSLPQETTPAELIVRRNVRGFELAEAFGKASVRVARGDEQGARQILDAAVAGSSRDQTLVAALRQLLGQDVDRSVKRAALAYAGQRRISHVAMRRH